MIYKYLACGILFTAALLFFSSCGSVKIEEMKMLETVDSGIDSILKIPVLKVHVDDVLSIQVSSRNPETVLAFQQQTTRNASYKTSGSEALATQEGYRVDEKGNIYLPFIGSVKAAGKPLYQLRQEITDALSDYIIDASVQVRFMNFRVTLLGEVSNPNTYTIPNERLTILEAIGMAGDFTPYARRNYVLLIRERTDQREYVRIDLQDRSLFQSPYFYLSPQDIIYVEPLKARAYATRGDFIDRYARALIPLTSVLTFFLGVMIK